MFRPLFSAVFALAFFTLTTVHAEPIDLKVMSFNVRYGSANDGDNSWPNRRTTVVNVIKQYDPDIIGTQETLRFQADYIRGELRDYDSFGMSRQPGEDGERMEIFYKKSVLAPIEIGHFWLSETPDVPGSKSWDSSLPRMATWTKFWHIATGQYFYYLNTHFDHRGEVARNEAARIIAEQMTNIAGDAHVIITGDFNTIGGKSDPWKTITQTFKDCWDEAEEQFGPLDTFGGFNEPNLDSDRRIDWILYRGAATVRRCETVTYEEHGRYPSDHYPIYAEIQLNLE